MHCKFGVCFLFGFGVFLGMGKTYNKLKHGLLLVAELLEQENGVQEWLVLC